MLLIMLTGCGTNPVSSCDVDRGLIVKIDRPERPIGKVTNGDLAKSLRTLGDKVDVDNVRKEELTKQLDACS